MPTNQTLQSFKRNLGNLNKTLDSYQDIFEKKDLMLIKSINNQTLTLFNEIFDSLEKKVDAKWQARMWKEKSIHASLTSISW